MYKNFTLSFIILFAIVITAYVPLADAVGDWQLISGATEADLRCVYFIDNNTGWVGGAGGLIAHTYNAGDKWTVQKTNTTKILSDIHFANPKEGWAVGEEGIILHTDDGGGTWLQQNGGTNSSLYGVHFASATEGWAIGDFGLVLHTTNAGNTWETQFTDTTDTLRGVYFVPPKLVWAVGLNGTVIHSANGGQSWVKQPQRTTELLYGVHFYYDGKKGWVVGSSGTILVTDDGGESWKLQNTPTTDLIYAIHFVTVSEGWGAGDNGTILHTINSGETWEVESGATTQPLYDMSHAETAIWTVGNAGSILKQSGISVPSSEVGPLAMSGQVDIDIPHEPKIGTGILYIESQPPGAKIFLNGTLQEEKKTNVTISDLPPGRYEVKLAKTHRATAAKTALVKADEKISISVSLPSRNRQIWYLFGLSSIAGIAVGSYIMFFGE